MIKLNFNSLGRYLFKDSIRKRILKNLITAHFISNIKKKEYEELIPKLIDFLLKYSYQVSSFGFRNIWGSNAEIEFYFNKILPNFLNHTVTKDLIISYVRENNNIFYRDICSQLFGMTHNEFFIFEKRRILFENM